MLEVGTVHLRIFPPGEGPQAPDLVKADVAMEGATIFLTFSLEAGRWPFKVENDSDYPISFCQSVSDEGLRAFSADLPDHLDVQDLQRYEGTESDSRVSRAPRYTVHPHSSIDYAWDFPSAIDKKIRLLSQSSSHEIDILEIGNLPPFKFRTTRGSHTVSLDVRAEDGAQTLCVSNYVEEYSLYKPKLRRQNSVARSDTLTGTEAFETVQASNVVPNLTLNLDFEGFGLSLVNKRMVEVVYLSSTAVKFEYVDSDAAQTINLSLGAVQVDNQLHDAQYPVVLQPTPVSKSSDAGTADLPAMQASLMVLKDDCKQLPLRYVSCGGI